MDAKVGVSVIIVNDNDEVLVGTRKGSHGAGMLSVPGGHLEFNESWVTCCDRELLEEIGVNFDGEYTPFGFSEDFFHHNGEDKHYITLYFVVDDVKADSLDIQNMEPNKCEGWNWVAFKDLPEEMFCDTQFQINKYFITK